MAKVKKTSAKDPGQDRDNQFGHPKGKKRYGYDASFTDSFSFELMLGSYDLRETILPEKSKKHNKKKDSGKPVEPENEFNELPLDSGMQELLDAYDPREILLPDKQPKEQEEETESPSAKKPVETEGEYKSFMAGELSVATDKHDVKAKQESDGRHVLEPEKTSEEAEEKDKPVQKTPHKEKKDHAKEVREEAKKHSGKGKKNKHSGKDHHHKGKHHDKHKGHGKDKHGKEGVESVTEYPEIPLTPSVTPEDTSKAILEMNLKPPTEAEMKVLQETGQQAEKESAARKQTFLTEVEQAKASLRQQMAEQKAAIHASFSGKKQQIVAQAAAQKEAVRASVSAAKAKTQADYAQMLAKLDEHLAADIVKVNTGKQEKLAALTEGITQKKTEFATYIQQKEAEPQEFARSEGARIQSELSAAADLCIQQSSSVAAGQSKDESKQAAMKVGEESAKDIRAKIAPMQQNVMDLANELKGNFSEYKTRVDAELDKAESELKPVIENLAQETIQKLQSDHDALKQAQIQARQKDLAALDQVQAKAIAQIEHGQAEALRGLEKSFTQSNSSLEQLGKPLLSGMDHLKTDTMHSLAGPGHVYLPGVIAILDDARAHLSRLQSTGNSLLKQQAATTTEGFTSTAAAFARKAASDASSASATASKLQSQTQKRLDETFNKYSVEADKSTANFEKQAQQSVGDGLKEIDTSIGKIKEKIEAQNREAKEKLTTRTNENIDKAKSPLKDDNRSRSEQAAEKAGHHSWWDVVKGVFAAILTIAIMFVVVIIVAAVIVAALAAIGLTVGLWTVVAVIGIGLLLYAGYKSYQKRSQQMKEGKLSGWGVFGMVISDSIGITDIYEGATNKDMVTGDDLGLDGYERGFRFTTGALTLVMTVVGVRGGVKGVRTKVSSNGGWMNTLRGLKGALGDAWGGLKGLPGKVHKPTWGGFKSGAGESISEISSMVKGMWDGMKGWVKGKPKGGGGKGNSGIKESEVNEEGLSKKDEGGSHGKGDEPKKQETGGKNNQGEDVVNNKKEEPPVSHKEEPPKAHQEEPPASHKEEPPKTPKEEPKDSHPSGDKEDPHGSKEGPKDPEPVPEEKPLQDRSPEEILDEALRRQGFKDGDAYPNGFKEKWSEGGYDYEVRIHPAEAKYGKAGNIYRVARRKQGVNELGQGYGWEYADSAGKWHPTSTLKPGKGGNSNPNYDPKAAEDTHIEVPDRPIGGKKATPPEEPVKTGTDTETPVKEQSDTPPSGKQENTNTTEEGTKTEEGVKNEEPVKNDKTGEKYQKLAEEAYEIYSKELPEALKILDDVAGEFGEIGGRAKRPESAANRLQRANERFNKKIENVQDAIDNTWDALGTRVVLNDASPATMDALVANLCEGIKSGKMEVVMANSLSGKNGMPYLTEAHLEQLKQAGASVNKPVDTSMKEYDTGYTIGAIYVKYKSGVRGEIQIIGKEVLKIANAEHLPYDAILNKPYLDAYKAEYADEAKALIEPIRNAAQSLDEGQKAAYNAYLNECYKNARSMESGGSASTVPLPDGLPQELSMENLLRVEEATKKYKK